MQCMEVWSGSQLTAQGVEFGGLDAWVYSKPYKEAQHGGDIYYASSCATGRITRFLLADVAGHGAAVASIAADLEFSELTIASLLGHRKASVTSRYTHHADAILLKAADAVADRVAELMCDAKPEGEVVPFKQSPK